MPTINTGPIEKERTLSNMDLENEKHVAKVTCGVQRKVNIGNFESIDVYCAASIPVEIEDLSDLEEIESKINDAMENLIYLTSKKTAEKYTLIKEN